MHIELADAGTRELITEGRRGLTIAGANAEEADSVRFAERHGFREADRQIEQLRVMGDESPAQAPSGVARTTAIRTSPASATGLAGCPAR